VMVARSEAQQNPELLLQVERTLEVPLVEILLPLVIAQDHLIPLILDRLIHLVQSVPSRLVMEMVDMKNGLEQLQVNKLAPNLFWTLSQPQMAQLMVEGIAGQSLVKLVPTLALLIPIVCCHHLIVILKLPGRKIQTFAHFLLEMEVVDLRHGLELLQVIRLVHNLFWILSQLQMVQPMGMEIVGLNSVKLAPTTAALTPIACYQHLMILLKVPNLLTPLVLALVPVLVAALVPLVAVLAPLVAVLAPLVAVLGVVDLVEDLEMDLVMLPTVQMDGIAAILAQVGAALALTHLTVQSYVEDAKVRKMMIN